LENPHAPHHPPLPPPRPHPRHHPRHHLRRRRRRRARTASVLLRQGHRRKIAIPTYLLGEPDPNPQFYFGGQSQGAQHRIYPYPAYDNLTTEKQSKTYTMVYLEMST